MTCESFHVSGDDLRHDKMIGRDDKEDVIQDDGHVRNPRNLASLDGGQRSRAIRIVYLYQVPGMISLIDLKSRPLALTVHNINAIVI